VLAGDREKPQPMAEREVYGPPAPAKP